MNLNAKIEINFMRNRKDNPKFYSFMAICIIISFVAIVLRLSVFSTTFVFGIVTAAISGIFLIVFLIGLIVLNRREKENKIRSRTQSSTSSTNLRNRHSYNQQVDASRRRLDQKKKYTKKKIIPLHSLAFIDVSEDYLCMVCKLALRKNQKTLICPFCRSYFHEEHLLDWLQMADVCPVCNNSLKE